eukprot:jgi/Ulvmu1/11497/UM077_0046.1
MRTNVTLSMSLSGASYRSYVCFAAQTRTAYPASVFVVPRALQLRQCHAQQRIPPPSASSGNGGNGPIRPPQRAVGDEDRDPHAQYRRSRWLVFAVIASTLLLVTQLRDRRRYNRWVARHSTAHSPEALSDAAAGDKTAAAAGAAQATTTVIIPVLNEEATLPELLAHLRTLRPAPGEVIFVDGGSTDRTREVIRRQPGVRLVTGPRGRSRQMNAGAAAATSDYLCFVHADTRPCTDLVHVIRYELASDRTVAGGFVTRITHAGRILPWQTTHHLLKTFYMPLLLRPWSFLHGLRSVLGDQNIFLRRADFEAAGGYDEALPIMEDADLTIRLHHSGTTLRPGKRARVRHVMYRGNETSGRRMAAWGGLKATALHFRIGLMWLFGCTPQQLQHVYDTLYTDSIRSAAAPGVA